MYISWMRATPAAWGWGGGAEYGQPRTSPSFVFHAQIIRQTNLQPPIEIARLLTVQSKFGRGGLRSHPQLLGLHLAIPIRFPFSVGGGQIRGKLVGGSRKGPRGGSGKKEGEGEVGFWAAEIAKSQNWTDAGAAMTEEKDWKTIGLIQAWETKLHIVPNDGFILRAWRPPTAHRPPPAPSPPRPPPSPSTWLLSRSLGALF